MRTYFILGQDNRKELIINILTLLPKAGSNHEPS